MRLLTAFSSLDFSLDAKEPEFKQKRFRFFATKIFCVFSLALAPITAAYAATTPEKPATVNSMPDPQQQLNDAALKEKERLPAQVYNDPNYVLAVVNGQKITVADISHLAKMMEPNLEHIPSGVYRFATLLGLYTETLAVSKAAEAKNYDKGPDFESELALARANLLQKIFFQKEVLDKISDAEIKARYNKEIASLPKEEEVRARHILVKTKAEAQAVIDRLNKGEKFEDIAKKLSKDGSASMGGDLGYFTRGQMVKPFEAVAFSLKPGEYTKKPIQTPFGWHVIKVEDKRLKQPPAFDDVKDMLRNLIARDRFAAIIKDLRKKYPITYPDPKIAKVMQDLQKEIEKATQNGTNEQD